jgi:hypothetical protein
LFILKRREDIMTNKWIPWIDRIEEFAPVFGLHKNEMFYPTSIEAFLEKSCELMVLIFKDSGDPVYGRINKFTQATLRDKILWMLVPKVNKRHNYLDRHGGKVDLKKSEELQQGYPKQLYVRGFRNNETGEAYIIYWFFYVENFVPKSIVDTEIADVLYNRPDSWWSHEGDWEGISVHFQDYQASNPTEVIFSQHNTSEIIAWDNIEKESNRILALPAIGSHAAYNKSLRKKRKFAFIVFGEIASPDNLYSPQHIEDDPEKSYSVVELVPEEKHHKWLNFKGRWGDSAAPFAAEAPTGPLMKRKKHFKMLADI